MTVKLLSNGDVSFCINDTCVSATGENAKILAYGALTLFVILGLSALAKSN